MRRRLLGMSLLGLLTALAVAAVATAGPATKTVAVTFTGGFVIQSDDYGRPVPLYASMLGVTPAIFRQAFSGVHPSSTHTPTAAEEQANKAQLLSVLGPYGVTNDEMDNVADYYRFDSLNGQTWPHRVATAVATIKGGKVISIRLTDGGSGYPYPPTVSIPGFPTVQATANLVFTTTFATNGHVGSITLAR